VRAWLRERLASHDALGRVRPPGGVVGIVLEEPTGATTALLSRGDSWDVYHGKQELVVFSTTPRNALRLAWCVLWTWWVRATWCGLKLRLWYWCLEQPKPAPKLDPDAVVREYLKTQHP